MDQAELMRKLFRLRIKRKARDRMQKVFNRLDDEFKELRDECVYAMLDGHKTGEKIGSIEVGGVLMSPYEELRAYIANPEEFRQWAETQDKDYLEAHPRPIQKNINAIAKRHLSDGEPLPPGVKFEMKPKMSMRRV